MSRATYPGPEDCPAPDAPLALAHTDWLRNLLALSGPAAEVARFRAAAQGTGGIPWHLDLDHEEARLFAPMAMLGPEARMLAHELREVIAARHDRVLTGWAGPGLCPFDLHRLIPIPAEILLLGAAAPASRAWLWTHWGTTQPLRHARMRHDHGDRRRRRVGRVLYEFYSADWTPWQAIIRLRREWPRLVLAIRPCHDDAAGAADA